MEDRLVGRGARGERSGRREEKGEGGRGERKRNNFVKETKRKNR